MGYLGGYVGAYLGAYLGAFEVIPPTGYVDYVGVTADPAGLYAYRGELDGIGYSYRGACDSGVEYAGVLEGDGQGYVYRGSLEPEDEEVGMFSMIVGDRLPSLTRVCRNAETDAAVDLTGGTAVSKFKIGEDGTIKTGTAVIVTAASGIVRCDWGASDMDAEGTCYLRIVVTIGGKTQTFPSDGSYFEFPVTA